MCTGLRHDDGSLVLVDGKMDPGRHLSSSETPHGIGPILAPSCYCRVNNVPDCVLDPPYEAVICWSPPVSADGTTTLN